MEEVAQREHKHRLQHVSLVGSNVRHDEKPSFLTGWFGSDAAIK